MANSLDKNMIDKDETNATDIVTLGLCIATGYAIGLITPRIGGIPHWVGRCQKVRAAAEVRCSCYYWA
jgi:hypothetical protein